MEWNGSVSNFDYLILLLLPDHQCYDWAMCVQWTDFYNLLPTLPTMQPSHWVTSQFLRFHATSTGATKTEAPENALQRVKLVELPFKSVLKLEFWILWGAFLNSQLRKKKSSSSRSGRQIIIPETPHAATPSESTRHTAQNIRVSQTRCLLQAWCVWCCFVDQRC